MGSSSDSPAADLIQNQRFSSSSSERRASAKVSSHRARAAASRRARRLPGRARERQSVREKRDEGEDVVVADPAVGEGKTDGRGEAARCVGR